VRDYEFYKVAKFGATGFSMGTPGMFAAISETKFQSFPEDIQNALLEAGRAAEENFCSYMDEDEAKSIEVLQTPEYGMTIHTWTPEQVAEMAEKTSSVLSGWVADLEERNIPAGDALKAYKAAIAAQ
jgi:TRAP-type C4-dicarboxylate transport system substrate-binding protein